MSESKRISLQSALNSRDCLPDDAEQALLIGRVWSHAADGPCVVTIEDGKLYDITAYAPTMSYLLNSPSPRQLLQQIPKLHCLGTVDQWLQDSAGQLPASNRLLAPCDLQSIKACGVTFIDSMLERIVEEQAQGDASRAASIRSALMERLGVDLSTVVPGSAKARELKEYLQPQGMWSQYMEVGLGEDAEIFSKSQPMSAVGLGEDVGLHPSSSWNNPEPEVVLAISNRGHIVGCALGNDVNLRDIEGRSALLLGRAKDNNRSCAIGPFIRLLDDNFTLADIKCLKVELSIYGEDGFSLKAESDLGRISRDIEDLVSQVIGPHHQYPDGIMLFTGTLYAPTEDRHQPGEGFTHDRGDLVKIRSPRLGALINQVGISDELPPWTFGIGALFSNLARRGYLQAESPTNTD